MCVGDVEVVMGSLCQDKRGSDLAVTSFFLLATAQCIARELFFSFFLFLFFLFFITPRAQTTRGSCDGRKLPGANIHNTLTQFPPPSSHSSPSLSDFHFPVPMFIRFWGTVF